MCPVRDRGIQVNNLYSCKGPYSNKGTNNFPISSSLEAVEYSRTNAQI